MPNKKIQVIDLTQQQQQQQELKEKVREIKQLKKQIQQLQKEKKSQPSKRKLVQTQRAQNTKKQTTKQKQQSMLTKEEYDKIVKEIKEIYRKVKRIYNKHMDEGEDPDDLPEEAFENKSDIKKMSAFLKFSKLSSKQVKTILDDLFEMFDPSGAELDPIEYLEIELNSILIGEATEGEPIVLETLLGVPRSNFYNLRADNIKGFSQTRYKEFLRLRHEAVLTM